MSSHPLAPPPRASFFKALAIQNRVIGALMMRELHTRYGRENIGYLWLIGEPLMLASVIGMLHMNGHTEYGSDIRPLPFTVVGYTLFIMFRGIVNRSEGAIEANAPLLYHRMVTVSDIVFSRALLEAAGTFMAYAVMMVLLSGIGWASLPVRPLYVVAAVGLMFWISLAQSLIITGISHENRTVGRLVHPYSYFMIPLSGAFFQVEWIPQPYREWLLWIPLPHIFELMRYGQFRSADLRYFDGGYVVAFCLVLTWVGLISVKLLRKRIHLS
ncbi:MAG: Capsular polysaccharide transport system permease protein [Sphingomonas bacterium]|jgi:capsular polysaccharide transport system permease protein|nr:Capsular polysaccharide transport system permease protein [Sphingomonas bacterium]MDB5685022.1 Capsular polysaccharide transport system permease protein [Sphingomonas bacterium]